MAGQKGFTLVELLVALLVFSFVAAAGVYALRLGVEARDQLATADKRLSELQLARTLIRDDMMQLVARPVRDEYGSAFGPAFQGGDALAGYRAAEGERLLVAFVRSGWSNPDAAAPRSNLQFVQYLEKDGALVRRIRPYLDDARGQPHFDRILIDDAESLEIGFLAGEIRGNLDWARGWPRNEGGDTAPPRAISLSYAAERFGALSLYFWIGDPYSSGRDGG